MAKKHYNNEMEAVLYTGFTDIKEEGKEYKDGDPIRQKEYVNSVSFYKENPETGEYTKVFVRKDFIVSLYKQISEIESIEHDGTYYTLPF